MDIEAQERAELRRKQIMVGALFVLALLLSMVFAYWMGLLGLGPTRHFTVSYDFAGGIDRGSPVRLAGVKVGRVSEIQFSSEPGARLSLKLEINSKAMSEVTQDAKFYINLAGIIGERYVEIVPGAGPRAAPGTVFRGVDPPRVDQLLSQGYGIFGDLRKLLEDNKGDIKDMLGSLVSLSRNLNSIFANATPDQRKRLNQLLHNLALMSEDMRMLVGDMNSPSTRAALREVASLIEKADSIELNDIRRLMLEDGMRVRLSGEKVPPKEEKKLNQSFQQKKE